MKKGTFTLLEAESSGFAGLHSDVIMRITAAAFLFVAGTLLAVLVVKANVAAVMLDEDAIHLEASAHDALESSTPR